MDKYIRSLNMLFSKEFQCEVMFSAGDEVQGLFDNVISALLYFRLLEMLMASCGNQSWNWDRRMDHKNGT